MKQKGYFNELKKDSNKFPTVDIMYRNTSYRREQEERDFVEKIQLMIDKGQTICFHSG